MHHRRRRWCREGGCAHSCTRAGSKPPGQGAPGREQRLGQIGRVQGHAKACSNGGSRSPGVGCCGGVVVRAQLELRGVRDVICGVCTRPVRRRSVQLRLVRCCRTRSRVCVHRGLPARRGVRARWLLQGRSGLATRGGGGGWFRARDGRQEEGRAGRTRWLLQGKSGLATRGGGGGGSGPGWVGERRKLLEVGRRRRRLPACHGGGGGAQAAGRPAAAAACLEAAGRRKA